MIFPRKFDTLWHKSDLVCMLDLSILIFISICTISSISNQTKRKGSFYSHDLNIYIKDPQSKEWDANFVIRCFHQCPWKDISQGDIDFTRSTRFIVGNKSKICFWEGKINLFPVSRLPPGIETFPIMGKNQIGLYVGFFYAHLYLYRYNFFNFQSNKKKKDHLNIY